MKSLQISATVNGRKGTIGKIFGPVEGKLYGYTIAIRNTGDEPLGSRWSTTSAYPGDVESIEFVWTFPSSQANHRMFPFPEQLDPGATYSFPEVEHNILSDGFGLLTARLRRLGQGLDMRVTNESGHVLPLGDSFEEQANVPGYGVSRYVAGLSHAIATFRASSRTEMFQLILITIATTALVANVILGILNYVK